MTCPTQNKLQRLHYTAVHCSLQSIHSHTEYNCPTIQDFCTCCLFTLCGASISSNRVYSIEHCTTAKHQTTLYNMQYIQLKHQVTEAGELSIFIGSINYLIRIKCPRFQQKQKYPLYVACYFSSVEIYSPAYPNYLSISMYLFIFYIHRKKADVFCLVMNIHYFIVPNTISSTLGLSFGINIIPLKTHDLNFTVDIRSIQSVNSKLVINRNYKISVISLKM